MHRLFARMLALSVPTVAAVNGHAFAGGALFALTNDRRVMHADRGFFCLPELDRCIALTPGLSDLLVATLGRPLAHQVAISGHRYDRYAARKVRGRRARPLLGGGKEQAEEVFEKNAGEWPGPEGFQAKFEELWAK